MGRRGGAEAVAVMALAVLALAGCGGSDDSALAGPEPWTRPDAVWMQPPGTPLGGALVVPEGAELIGPAFSNVGRRSPIDGGDLHVNEQHAYLYSEAAILDISNDLVNQLGGADVLGGQYNDTVCNQEIERGEGVTPAVEPYTGQTDPDAIQLLCYGIRPKGLADPPEAIDFELRQDLSQPDQPVLGIVRWGEQHVEVPNSLPDAPDGVGGPSVITTDVEGDPDLDVVDGSFLAGPQGWGSLTGGFTAVIGVTGDPDEVFDEYLQYQMPDPPEADDDTVGDLRVRRGTTGGAGGVTYTVTLNEIRGEAWILLEASND